MLRRQRLRFKARLGKKFKRLHHNQLQKAGVVVPACCPSHWKASIGGVQSKQTQA
jgi:hypothetical protein